MGWNNGRSSTRTALARPCWHTKVSSVYQLIAALHLALLCITISMPQFCWCPQHVFLTELISYGTHLERQKIDFNNKRLAILVDNFQISAVCPVRQIWHQTTGGSPLLTPIWVVTLDPKNCSQILAHESMIEIPMISYWVHFSLQLFSCLLNVCPSPGMKYLRNFALISSFLWVCRKTTENRS